jgi:hypothetical protein
MVNNHPCPGLVPHLCGPIDAPGSGGECLAGAVDRLDVESRGSSRWESDRPRLPSVYRRRPHAGSPATIRPRCDDARGAGVGYFYLVPARWPIMESPERASRIDPKTVTSILPTYLRWCIRSPPEANESFSQNTTCRPRAASRGRIPDSPSLTCRETAFQQQASWLKKKRVAIPLSEIGAFLLKERDLEAARSSASRFSGCRSDGTPCRFWGRRAGSDPVFPGSRRVRPVQKRQTLEGRDSVFRGVGCDPMPLSRLGDPRRATPGKVCKVPGNRMWHACSTWRWSVPQEPPIPPTFRYSTRTEAADLSASRPQ